MMATMAVSEGLFSVTSVSAGGRAGDDHNNLSLARAAGVKGHDYVSLFFKAL